MTPEEALNVRDSVWRRALKRNRGKEEAINGSFAATRVVVWQESIWDAATSGWAAFKGMPIPNDTFRAPEFWVKSGPMTNLPRIRVDGSYTKPIIGLLITPVQSRAGFIVLFIDADYDMIAVPVVESDEGTIAGGGLIHALNRYSDPCHERCAAVLSAACFMGQEFVGLERHKHPRSLKRAAEKKQRPPLPEINVVTLRRTHREERPSGYRGEPRDYDHSWLRSAHWRKQLCRARDASGEKSKDGAWEVRPVYVRACVCGPEDKPLRTPKGTVYAVTR